MHTLYDISHDLNHHVTALMVNSIASDCEMHTLYDILIVLRHHVTALMVSSAGFECEAHTLNVSSNDFNHHVTVSVVIYVAIDYQFHPLSDRLLEVLNHVTVLMVCSSRADHQHGRSSSVNREMHTLYDSSVDISHLVCLLIGSFFIFDIEARVPYALPVHDFCYFTRRNRSVIV